ncbi:MAG: hypothetical protein HDS27_05455 [Bacteroides sp.]|nr:hypothetical protein [Bacteroides sp.]
MDIIKTQLRVEIVEIIGKAEQICSTTVSTWVIRGTSATNITPFRAGKSFDVGGCQNMLFL